MAGLIAWCDITPKATTVQRTYHKWPSNLVDKQEEVQKAFKLGITPAYG